MPEQSTTPDLVERARRAYEAFIRRDVDGGVSFLAPDAVFEVTTLGTTFEGVDAILGFWEEWMGVYEEFEAEIQEVVDLGAGVGFVVMAMSGRPVGSSGHVRYRIAQVSTWTDGLVVRIAGYLGTDIDQARAAAERLAEERG